MNPAAYSFFATPCLTRASERWIVSTSPWGRNRGFLQSCAFDYLHNVAAQRCLLDAMRRCDWEYGYKNPTPQGLCWNLPCEALFFGAFFVAMDSFVLWRGYGLLISKLRLG